MLKSYLRKEGPIIVHFGYHKAMTSFFHKVFIDIAPLLRREYFHAFNNLFKFYEKLASMGSEGILCLNNHPAQTFLLPNYVGSHIVRDPRDLLVSGYKYHLWSEESWVNIPISNAMSKKLKINKYGLHLKQDESYRQLLNRVDKDLGYQLEFNWRQPHFTQMQNWDYENPNIIEVKYEDIFQNENVWFQKIFKHYGVPDILLDVCLKIVEKHSFKVLQKQGNIGDKKHARIGSPGQWKEELPGTVAKKLLYKYTPLMTKLNYLE